jgi:putative glycerol-1-phosphate prenyltransferase
VENFIANSIEEFDRKGKKGLAILIDPDKADEGHLQKMLLWANKVPVSYIFIGGSLLLKDQFHKVVRQINDLSEIPILLFPGNNTQISPDADGILFLSLLSGRNAELLIGQHVHAAPQIRDAGLEAISTAYLLVDGGKATTASYISQSLPIPADKPEISATTALAGKYLGFQCIYLDAGSGAEKPVPVSHIEAVKHATGKPVIVGGGIRSVQRAEEAWKAGADIIVVGNALEASQEFADELAVAFHSINQSKNQVDRDRHSIHR